MHYLRYLYRFGKKRRPTDRLVMTYVVRNEADIMAANIKVHAALGVDAFIVMDNGSTDGTYELVEGLTTNYDIELISRTEPYKSWPYAQKRWQNEMLGMARKQHGADWIISNDADEFYVPNSSSGDLKTHLTHRDSVITLHRANMLLTDTVHDAGYKFWHSTHRVASPVLYTRTQEVAAPNIAMPLIKISPKVIVNANGVMKVSGGNHRARHMASWLTARRLDAITVYHYPLRSFASFKQHIEHRARLAKMGVNLSIHYQRWVTCLKDGRLEAEFEKFVFSDTALATLMAFDIVAEDAHPKNTLATLLA